MGSMSLPAQPNNSDSTVHNIVFTIPRTCSHLLLQVLNLPAQRSIHRPPSDGYFFLGPLAYKFQNDLAGRHVSAWTPKQQEVMKAAFQESYDTLSKFHSDAEQLGKNTVVKEHINWMLDPIAESQYLHRDPHSHSEVSTTTSNIIGSTASPWRSDFTVTASKTRCGQSGSDYCSRGNETVLPDHVLRSLRPTFLIRNPMLTFPSLLRTSTANERLESVLEGEETQRWEMSFHWTRALYEFYMSHAAGDTNRDASIEHTQDTQLPIIIDADDILSPRIITRYASLVGLDPSVIRNKWDAVTPDEYAKMSAMEKRMKDTLLKSSGIVEGKTVGKLVLEEEVVKWRVEFGDVLGERLERLVRGAMRDYVWLWERRLGDEECRD